MSPLPFDLSFVKHKYFLTDATFFFKAKPNLDEDYILSNSFVTGRHLMFLIQKDSASMIGFRRNKEGTIKLGVNYEEVYEWLKDNFTTAGKLRKIFRNEQLESFKDDPAWGT